MRVDVKGVSTEPARSQHAASKVILTASALRFHEQPTSKTDNGELGRASGADGRIHSAKHALRARQRHCRLEKGSLGDGVSGWALASPWNGRGHPLRTCSTFLSSVSSVSVVYVPPEGG